MKSKYAIITAFVLLLLGNVASAQYFTGTDLGGTGVPGSIVTNFDGSYTVSGSGGDIWGNADQFYYYYAWASGTQWVATVQITDLQGPDNWTKGELMVRSSDPTVGPQANDGFIAAMATRAGGQNEVGDQFRANRNDGADWVELAPVWRPTYPSQWLRLSRTNSSFTVAFSGDGSTWSNYLTIDTASSTTVGGSIFGHAWGDAVTVGLAVTAHNNAELGAATFQNLQVTFPAVTPPTVIGASRQVTNTSAYPGSPASFTFVTTNNAQPSVVSWPAYVNYQWFRNGSAIANATSTSYTRLLNPSDGSENGAQYYCHATVLPPYNGSVSGLNSATGTVTVLPGALYHTNGLKREFYAGGVRRDIENGNTPAPTSINRSSVDDPGGYGDNYTARRSGWFVAPATDYYVFFLACDDDTDLFLSTNGNPANKQLIAQEEQWSPTLSWLTSGGGTTSQKRSDMWSPDSGATMPYSGGIPLNAGTSYYIEIVHHNGTGGDNFAVTYQTTNEIADVNWPVTFTNGLPSRITNGLILITGPTTSLVWSLQPTNTSVSQGNSANFFARSTTDNELVPFYQWYHNGVLIPGATRNSLGTGITTPANNGDTYFVVSSTEEGSLSITSSIVTLNVISAIMERGWASVEFWQGGNRGAIESGAAGSPTYRTTSPAFEASVNNETGSGYGRRVSGYFFAPATDDYVFFVNSDDDSDLFISTDSTPANKRLVAQETAYSNPLSWITTGGGSAATKRSDSWQGTNASPPYAAGIHLIAGQQYYMEIVQTEGGGGDNVEATYKRLFTTAGTPEPDPWNGMDSRFRGSVLGTFVPRCSYVAFTQQPASVTVAPSLSGTITFTASGVSDSTTPVGTTGDVRPLVGNWPYVMYQWQKNGVDIPGATSSAYKFAGPVLPSDNGAVFTCRIRALGYADNSLNPIWSNSTPATLTVPSIPLVYETGKVLVEHWNNKVRSDVEAGTAGALAWVSTSPEFAVSTNNGSGDNYARRLVAYFTPPATDNYVFWITADDDADLFLSTDASPLNKRLIARVDNWADPFHWNTGNGTLSNKRSDMFSDWATGLNNGFGAGIHLLAGQRYYLEAVHHEGGGGDNLEVTYSTVTGTPVADFDDTLLKGSVVGILAPVSHVAITNQPVNTTIPSYSPVTFSVGANTDSQISFGNAGDIRTSITTFLAYQWYRNGTPLAGATGSGYTLAAPLPSDNGSQFYCAVRSIGLADGSGNATWSNSVTATLTVITNTPQFLYAAIYTNANSVPFNGITSVFVTLAFDSPMDPVLLSQMSSYTLGGGLTILSVTVNSNDYRSVVLEVSGTPTFPFSVTLNSGVRGLGGGRAVANTTLAVSKVPLTNQDIGVAGSDPAYPGAMVPEGPNAYMIACEGSDIWNNADGFNFSYERKTNDFDVVVRQKDTRHISNWSKGGLMLRETLDAGSRNWNIVNDPLASDGIMAVDGSGFGANVVEANARNAVNGATGGWDFNRGPSPAFPNAWVRLTRQGQNLSAYRSTDGLHWTLAATNNPTLVGDLTPLPNVIYVGICATAHHNDDPGTPADQLRYLQVAHFADYNSSYTPPATLTITISGANATVSWLPTVGHLEASPALGAGANWQPVSGGATSPVIVPLSSGARFFRVVNP